MDITKSSIVTAIAGRDKGKIFVTLEIDNGYALIADGKSRKLEKPKRKKLKHLRHFAKCEERLAEKLLSGEKVTNSEVRKVISRFNNQQTQVSD